MKKNRIKKMIILGLLFINLPSPSYAEPLSTIIKDINDLETKITELELEVEDYDSSIILAMERLEQLKEEVVISEANVKKIAKEVENAENDYQLTLDIAKDRLRNMQQREGYRYLEFITILLDANGLADLINRTQAIRLIIESDQKIIERLSEKENQVKEKERKLQIENRIIKRKLVDIENEKRFIENEKQTVLKKVEELEKLLEKRKRDKANEEARQRAAEIARQNRMQSFSPSQTYSGNLQDIDSEKARIVIEEAMKYLGVPYVWGGTSPNGFDCSGLTQYVYRKAGVNLPRVSQQQMHVGTPVPLNQLQPGDLLHRGNPSTHVAIYIGNNQFLHAPRTGDVVKIETLTPNRFTSATRVL